MSRAQRARLQHSEEIMALYDGVVGIEEAALNQFVQSAYQALHDVALKGTVVLLPPESGVSAIGYDVASVPQVSLSPSALVQQYHRAVLAAMNVPAESLDSAAAAQSQSSFGLTVQTLQRPWTTPTVRRRSAARSAGLAPSSPGSHPGEAWPTPERTVWSFLTSPLITAPTITGKSTPRPG